MFLTSSNLASGYYILQSIVKLYQKTFVRPCVIFIWNHDRENQNSKSKSGKAAMHQNGYNIEGHSFLF